MKELCTNNKSKSIGMKELWALSLFLWYKIDLFYVFVERMKEISASKCAGTMGCPGWRWYVLYLPHSFITRLAFKCVGSPHVRISWVLCLLFICWNKCICSLLVITMSRAKRWIEAVLKSSSLRDLNNELQNNLEIFDNGS